VAELAQPILAVHRPPRVDLALLGVGVLAVGTSGPLIAATAAPALAIAMWRNVFGAAALAPAVLWRHRHELARLSRRQWLLTLTSGATLGLHFTAWTPSLKMTSVASATAFAALQPVWAALIAHRRGHHVPGTAWAGIAVAVVGVFALSGSDLAVSPRAFAGDMVALLAGALAAIYMTLGSEARQAVSLPSYATLCYVVASGVIALVALGAGQSLTGFGGAAWLKILGLTAGAQLLGHTVFNRVLKTTSATVVSTAILLEVPAAAILAALWLHQVPRPAALPGAVLIVMGLLLVVRQPRVA
jgi:drug/metabolite transporter (DMT)-like permease